MISRYEHKGSAWIDIINPSKSDIEKIIRDYAINPSVADELTLPSVKSRVELHKEYIYLILHFPAFKHTHSNDSSKQEVDFIIGKNFLITARYETIDALDKFAKIMEVRKILNRGYDENPTGIIFFGILQEIYSSLENELAYIGSWLDRIESEIFAGREKQMVVALSKASRNLLNFKRSIDFHEEVFSSLDSFGKKIFDEHFTYHVRRISDEYLKVVDSLKNNLEFVAELRETNNSLLSTKENEIMKVLTVMAFIGIPLSLSISLLQVSTFSSYFIKGPNDLWVFLGGLVVIGFTMYFYFKHKKWL